MLAVILFLVLMVAGEGAWTTKEQAWGSMMENKWVMEGGRRTKMGNMGEGGRRNRIVREVNRLYDCRLADERDLDVFVFIRGSPGLKLYETKIASYLKKFLQGFGRSPAVTMHTGWSR